MNRIDFMAQLKRLLSDIPESDRNDAIAYYNDYFDEAGADNEAQVIRELGNPGKVAAMIRASLRSAENSKGEYTESGYQEAGADANRQSPMQRGAGRYAGTQPRRGGGKMVLIIIAAIFAAPFILGIGGSALGIFVGLVAGLIGIIVSLFGAAIAGTIVGIIGIVTGVIEIFTSPATGLMMVGGGMITLAVTLTLICLAVWLCANIIPKLFRGIANLMSRVLHRGTRGGEAQ